MSIQIITKTIAVTIAFILLPLNFYPVSIISASSLIPITIDKNQDDGSPHKKQEQIMQSNGVTTGISDNMMMTMPTRNGLTTIDVPTNSSTTERSTDATLLTIRTSIINKCKPSSMCADIRADDLFSYHIFIFLNNTLKEPLVIPASEEGWTVKLLPALAGSTVQYYVKQNIANFEDMKYGPWNVSYSPDCQGTVKTGQNRTCIISNDISSPQSRGVR